MRTDHCSATLCAAAPWAANLSGWASRCRSFQCASMTARSCANCCGRPKSSKSVAARFTLDAETLSAAAAVPLVRIVELEAFIEALAHEVEFRAVDVGKALRVDQQLDAVVLEHDVLRRYVIDVLQLVGQAGAAGGLHAQAHTHALATLGQITGHVPRRG